MNMYEEDCGEILVCTDCLHSHANGEYSPDRPDDEPEPMSAIPFGYVVAMGGEHNEHCTDSDREAGCECDHAGFCQSQCEGCGSWLHGDRYRFTMWRATKGEALANHRAAVGRARAARIDGAPRYKVRDSLAVAAEWRGYLADRFRESRRHAEWLVRHMSHAA